MSDEEMEQVGCKCYRPGDQGFEALAARITPLELTEGLCQTTYGNGDGNGDGDGNGNGNGYGNGDGYGDGDGNGYGF